MGLWQWIDALPAEADRSRLRKEAVQGRLWLLMPYREITLVHAVQRPVLPPAHVDTLTVDRRLADTSATVGVTIQVHGFSTDNVELRAAWTDPLDDPSAPTGKRAEAHVAVLAAKPVRRGDSEIGFSGVGHHFGNTKYHRVTYSAVATSSFREYFHPNDPPGDKNPPRDFTRGSEPATDLTEDVPSSARPPAPGVVSAIPAFMWHRDTGERRCAGALVQVRDGERIRIPPRRGLYRSGRSAPTLSAAYEAPAMKAVTM